MTIFVTGSLLLLSALLLHVVLWKVKRPRQQLKSLLLLFALVFAVWSIWTFSSRALPFFSAVHVALFYWAAALCYVITYSAIEADSPTLSLVRFVAEAGTTGRSSAELAEFMARRPFVRARLGALLQSRLIREEHGRYHSAGDPPLAFRLILEFRKLFGSIERGG